MRSQIKIIECEKKQERETRFQCSGPKRRQERPGRRHLRSSISWLAQNLKTWKIDHNFKQKKRRFHLKQWTGRSIRTSRWPVAEEPLGEPPEEPKFELWFSFECVRFLEDLPFFRNGNIFDNEFWSLKAFSIQKEIFIFPVWTAPRSANAYRNEKPVNHFRSFSKSPAQ